uniref:DUF2269 family protein n=1 Tax=candidate division CPR3 bacterium TaxID=2268181 RepID=A0A7C4M356_UNCC3
MEFNLFQFIGLFILIAGYIIGLGAVTVIDLHGFLGRNSPYWTEATIRTHKITKPLIWAGTVLSIIGAFIFYETPFIYYHLIIFFFLVLNGLFLSFVVSPYLIKKEKQGKSKELLPMSFQYKITASFLVSFAGWWGSLLILIYSLLIK